MSDHPRPIARITLTRRSVARGAAWAAPAAMVAGAAPAFATSGPPPTFEQTGQCKSPGNSCAVFPKGYEFRFTVCNPSNLTIYLYGVTYAVTGTNLTLTHSLPTLPVALAPGVCVPMVFRADSSNSSNQTFTGTMFVTWGHTPTAGADPDAHPAVQVPITVNGTPPDCVCSAAPIP